MSDDPENVAGELVCRGINVMKGYYKNQEATDAVIDKDGWFHTGDLATMAADGHIFVRGRSKNMLLGPNGQNIYPEEIEDKLNSMAMVNESIVIQSDDKLVALVHPDMEEVNNLGFTDEDLENIMEQNRQELNMQMPSFAKVSRIKLHDQEFERQPRSLSSVTSIRTQSRDRPYLLTDHQQIRSIISKRTSVRENIKKQIVK